MVEENNSPALIHMNVPKHVKADWVRRSRLQGQKLTDWILACVDSSAYGAKHGLAAEPLSTYGGDAVYKVERAFNPDDVAQLRVRTGLTQSALAERLDVSVSIVQKWEGNTSPIPPLAKEMLLLLADAHPSLRLVKRDGN